MLTGNVPPTNHQKEERPMQKCIIGKKLGMTQIFDEKGTFIPVTVIEAGPCIVVQKKTKEIDGYEAIQVGYREVSDKHINKPQKGHFQKADVANKKYLRDFILEDISAVSVGDLIKADAFAPGDKVDVSGISKGKGYAGTIKRYGTRSLKDTHGTGPVHRHAGSMGANSDPSRVMKGKKLPGHMGAERVTIQNLDIVKVDAENNLIALRGAIPGPKGGIVCITDAVKGQKA
jgi:large subunit ribosomal protein L3